MLKKRDAQHLSTSVIILAVLGLLVLLALVYIFTQESGKTSDTLGSCFVRGGECKSKCVDGETPVPEFECKYEDDSNPPKKLDGDCCVTV